MDDWNILPLLIERAGGGWLAITPEESPIRLGVTAATELAAREKFALSVKSWTESLEAEKKARADLGQPSPI